MIIRIKRVYDPPAASDGKRILVDRLWPRGLSKATAHIDLWAKDVAPSGELRRWYGHVPEKWDEFQSRYFAELHSQHDALDVLRDYIGKEGATFLFGAKETQLNNAVVLKAYMERRARPGG